MVGKIKDLVVFTAVALGVTILISAISPASAQGAGSNTATAESEAAGEIDNAGEGEEENNEDEASTDNIKAAYTEGGQYFTEDDIPTFNIGEDGTVDWVTYSGFRRYHSECHVCHGPEGEGSTYAPALKTSAIDMDYYDFVDVVANGRKRLSASENSVMPALGANPNVMCYLDDIYVYLKARGVDAVPRGRPKKKEPKSDEIREIEEACLGG